jgi:hypothetical protein
MGLPRRTSPAPAKRSRGRAVTGATFVGRSRSVSSEQKAIFHNVLGAGRRGVMRRFLGMGEARTEAARETLERLVDARLGSQQ